MDGDEVPGLRRSGDEWATAWRIDGAALPPLDVRLVVSQDEAAWPPPSDASFPPRTGP